MTHLPGFDAYMDPPLDRKPEEVTCEGMVTHIACWCSWSRTVTGKPGHWKCVECDGWRIAVSATVCNHPLSAGDTCEECGTVAKGTVESGPDDVGEECTP